jgi:hypothetical protein
VDILEEGVAEDLIFFAGGGVTDEALLLLLEGDEEEGLGRLLLALIVVLVDLVVAEEGLLVPFVTTDAVDLGGCGAGSAAALAALVAMSKRVLMSFLTSL